MVAEGIIIIKAKEEVTMVRMNHDFRKDDYVQCLEMKKNLVLA